MAIVEYARNVVGLKDVYSAEIKPQAKTKIVEIMEEQKKQMNLGGTMRLGETEVKFAKDSKIAKIYGCLKIGERHRHRFEMNNEYIASLEKKGMVFSGFFAGSSVGSSAEILLLEKLCRFFWILLLVLLWFFWGNKNLVFAISRSYGITKTSLVCSCAIPPRISLHPF